jgi:predicted HicB family RNase H-like nuclease
MSRTFPLRLPESIRRPAEDLAREDGVSLNRFVAVAVAEGERLEHRDLIPPPCGAT